MWLRTSIVIGAVALAGCEQMKTDGNAPLPETTTRSRPDNSAVNERDASGETKTPINQDENKADLDRTAEIRKRILDQPDLSVNAGNAKVITSQGKVTLRGPVNSEAERDLLARIAIDVAGAGNVDNQLEVKPAER